MGQSSVHVKRIAKNTGIVYIRMVMLIIIAFYTSRVLLKTLGVNDFGVFSVVGSISATFVSIKSLFSESIQRFLNVSKGKNSSDYKEQISIFNISIVIHLFLIIVFVIIVEIVGLWLLKTKLDIPPERYDAAVFVFQMSVLATSIGILSIPYDAVIIANEKMGFYAAITVFDGLLKLLFVFLLPIIGHDYLKTYSLLVVFIPISTLLLQLLYSRRFKECSINFKIEKGLFHDIFSLSSWNFFGNISFSLIHEGINILLNVFGGVVMNSARAIAYQVRAVTSQLSSNTMLAVRPFIMQKSASLELLSFYDSIITLSRLSFFTILVPSSALILFAPQLLAIWLEIVPDMATLFTQIVLFTILIRSLHEPLNIMYMSFGKVKRYLVIESIIMLFFLVIVFVTLKLGAPIWTPFIVLSIMEAVIVVAITYNAYVEIQFPLLQYYKRVIFPVLLLIAVSAMIMVPIYFLWSPTSIIGSIGGVVVVCLIEVLLCYIFMEQKERNLLKGLIKR